MFALKNETVLTNFDVMMNVANVNMMCQSVVRWFCFLFRKGKSLFGVCWFSSNGGLCCEAAVRRGSGWHGRSLRRVRSEGMVLRSCSAGFWRSWLLTTSTAM